MILLKELEMKDFRVALEFQTVFDNDTVKTENFPLFGSRSFKNDILILLFVTLILFKSVPVD